MKIIILDSSSSLKWCRSSDIFYTLHRSFANGRTLSSSYMFPLNKQSGDCRPAWHTFHFLRLRRVFSIHRWLSNLQPLVRVTMRSSSGDSLKHKPRLSGFCFPSDFSRIWYYTGTLYVDTLLAKHPFYNQSFSVRSFHCSLNSWQTRHIMEAVID